MKLQITIPQTEVHKYFTEIDRLICNSGIPNAGNIARDIASAAHRVALDAFELGRQFGRRNPEAQPEEEES